MNTNKCMLFDVFVTLSSNTSSEEYFLQKEIMQDINLYSIKIPLLSRSKIDTYIAAFPQFSGYGFNQTVAIIPTRNVPFYKTLLCKRWKQRVIIEVILFFLKSERTTSCSLIWCILISVELI